MRALTCTIVCLAGLDDIIMLNLLLVCTSLQPPILPLAFLLASVESLRHSPQQSGTGNSEAVSGVEAAALADSCTFIWIMNYCTAMGY